MANFCGHCGAANDGGEVCASCGRPFEGSAPPADVTMVQQPGQHAAPPAPGPPAAPPPYAGPPQPSPTAQFPPAPQAPPPVPPQGQPMPPQGYPAGPPQPYAAPGYPPQPGYGPPGYGQPVAPKVNPFIGWPISDYVRDGAAAFFLFATLGMPWMLSEDEAPWAKGGNVWWVIIAVLLSVVSLAVPYVAKARVIPNWGPPHYRYLKLGLNAPLVLSVLAALVNELINLNEGIEDRAGGLGSGIGMALAGVAMAVQPRQCEEEPGNADDRRWNTVTKSVVLAAVGLQVVLFALWFLNGVVSDDADIFDPVMGFVLILVATLAMPLAVVGWPAYSMVFTGPSPAWRRVLATSGFSVLVIALFSLASDYDGLFIWPPLEKWNGYLEVIPGGGVLLVGAAAALAVSRAQVRATAQATDPVTGWVRTVGAALLVSAAGCGIYAVSVVLEMLAVEEFEVAGIIVVVLAGVAAGGAVFAHTLLGDARKNRVVLLGVLGGIAVLGFVSFLVVNGEDFGQGIDLGRASTTGVVAGTWYANSGWAVAAFFALPGLAAYALTVPPEVRAAFGPLVASTPVGYPPPSYGGPG